MTLGADLRAMAAQADEADRSMAALRAANEELTQRAAEQLAEIDRLRALLEGQTDPEPEPPPATRTLWGTNGSSVSEWKGNAPFHPEVCRYFFQPGEGVHYPPNAPKTGDRVVADHYVVSSKMTPQQILTGSWDDDIERSFRDAPTDRDYWYSIWHEPEDDIERGAFTAAQLIAAHRRVTGIARRVGPHIKMVPIYMQFTLQGGKGRKPMDYWPGDDYVDAVGVDCYQWTKTTEGKTPAQMFDAAIDFAKARNKPLIIAECGVDIAAFGPPNSPGRTKAIRDAFEALVAKAAAVGVEVVAVCYFNRSRWVLTGADLAALLSARTA